MSFAFLFHLFRRQSVLKARRSLRSLYEAFSVDSTSTEDELTSLLTHRRKGLLKWRDSGIGFEPDGQQVTSFHEAWTETKQVLEFTWPLVIAYLAGTGTRLIDVWFLGRLGAQVLAIVSLANLFATVCGLAMGNGLLTATDTLVAQAFTGASDSKTLGIIFQRSLAIMAVYSAAIGIFWTYAETILVKLGQDPELAAGAQSYLYICILVTFFVFASTTIRKFLQALGKMRVIMFMFVTLVPFNILSNFIFLNCLHLGHIGAALNFVCWHLLILGVFSGFLLLGTDFRRSYWPGWSRSTWIGWGAFLKLGVPGMLSVSTDWAFEVCALITGTLGKASLAGQHIVLTFNALLLMLPAALASALAVRVGHHLGANRSKKIKICVVSSVFLGGLVAVSNATLMFTLRHSIASWFTADANVIQAAVDLFPVACLAHIVMALVMILSSTLNALGKQPVVAVFNILSYYTIGLPLGLLLTLSYEWGLIGIWSGVVVAGLLQCMGKGIILTFLIDWDDECAKTMKRIGSQERTNAHKVSSTQSQSNTV